MSRKLVAVAGAIALVGAGMVLGSLSLAKSSQTRGPDVRFRVFSPDAQAVEEQVNVAPKDVREGLGDYLVGYGPLLNKRGGKKVGGEKHQCFNIGETEDTFTILCNASFWLEGRGKISAHGSFKIDFEEFESGRPVAVLSVTGGTGEFRNARGVVALTFRRHGATFTFDLP